MQNRSSLPMALGHEAGGIVEEAGPGVDDLARGDHVVCVFVPSCGHCGPCAEGRPAVKRSRTSAVRCVTTANRAA